MPRWAAWPFSVSGAGRYQGAGKVEAWLDRAERELGHDPQDAAGTALLQELQSYAELPARSHRPAQLRAADVLLPVHIKRGDLELRLFSTIMTLGTPHDVTLQELRLETTFPADEESDRCWRALFG